MKQAVLHLGLDVHSQSIAIAIAAGSGGEARTYGAISGDLHALEKALAKIKQAHPGHRLKVCYGAGPSGFDSAPPHGSLTPAGCRFPEVDAGAQTISRMQREPSVGSQTRFVG